MLLIRHLQKILRLSICIQVTWIKILMRFLFIVISFLLLQGKFEIFRIKINIFTFRDLQLIPVKLHLPSFNSIYYLLLIYNFIDIFLRKKISKYLFFLLIKSVYDHLQFILSNYEISFIFNKSFKFRVFKKLLKPISQQDPDLRKQPSYKQKRQKFF